MAIPAIQVSDFVGQIRLSYDTFSSADMQAVIDEKYPDLLREYIGQESYAWLESNALTAEWTVFFDGGQYTDLDGEEQYTEGYTRCAKYLLYFYLLRDANWINTPVGNVHNQSENATLQSNANASAVAINRYNQAINWLFGVHNYVKATPYFEENFPNMPLPYMVFTTIG